MAPFVETLGRFGQATPRDFARVKKEDRHNIQTHTDYMTMLVNKLFIFIKKHFMKTKMLMWGFTDVIESLVSYLNLFFFHF